MAKLIVTNSYFNLFPLLVDALSKNDSLDKKNVVFLEEKVSLMAERIICNSLGGSFNTDVYSFGNYLRAKKQFDKLLTKEGSAMVVKRIISDPKMQLKCFRSSKSGLALSLFELISQLKSAKISSEELLVAQDGTGGILKNKLGDITAVYSEYERYVKENGFDDQSSMLSYLPEMLAQSEEIKNADVYLVGFASFTAQTRSAISTLLDNAKSVTAILTEGDNEQAFVNETARVFRSICKDKRVALVEEKVDSDYTLEGKALIDCTFNPVNTSKRRQVRTDKIRLGSFVNVEEEITAIASIIRRGVLSGEYRYKDFTLGLGLVEEYRDQIERIFTTFEIPYFLDERKASTSHPLITLILSYIDVFRKNFRREEVLSFVKNPLFESDKNLSDAFENYILKYNVNYGAFKKPFTVVDEDIDFATLERLRQKCVAEFERFDVLKMLIDLGVEQSLASYTNQLNLLGEREESAVNDQIYGAVTGILAEMQLILNSVSINKTEFRNIFLSGINALKLSIIPQYSDAVFVGGFKEVALAKSRRLFLAGLTTNVPDAKADVALLSDIDIEKLEKIKLLVEPKIRVVNHRTRENVALALGSFSEELYLSYPTSNVDGKKIPKSQIISTVEKLFDLKVEEDGVKKENYPRAQEYLTLRQGEENFARDCSLFAECSLDDFSTATAFYKVVGKQKLKLLLDRANKEVKERLDCGNRSIIGKVTSPTTIEDYYKCPYLAFASHSLRLKSRDDGSVSSLSIGNLMHEILKDYVREISVVKDKDSSDALCEKVKDRLFEREEYKKFLLDPVTKSTVDRVLSECKKYCYKTYETLKDSTYKSRTEVSFGDGDKCDYPAISLLDGKVKLKGKIDRVDEQEKRFRVLDYKTGKADPSDALLFSGNKLQLYLYAKAVMQKYGNDKLPIGLYYLPVSDKYGSPSESKQALAIGKTAKEILDETAFKNALDKNAKGEIKNQAEQQAIIARVEYAVKCANEAVKNMADGYIRPLPFEGACEYCEYKALCNKDEGVERTIGKVDDQTFIDALKEGEKDGTN